MITDELKPQALVAEVVEIYYRLATLSDELHIITAFSRMLRELEPLGHNVLPTEHNISIFETAFMEAIAVDKHGIVLAFVDGNCIGATFFTPDNSGLDTPGKLAVAHGAWVEPEWRGQGVAKSMQKMAHARLRDLGYTQLVSVVVIDNKLGYASATAAGARVTGYFTTVNLLEDN